MAFVDFLRHAIGWLSHDRTVPPFYVAAAGLYNSGAIAGEAYSTGAAASELFHTGLALNADGSYAGEALGRIDA